MQSSAAGLHWAKQDVPQSPVHIDEAATVQPPLQPAMKLIGLHSPVQPPSTLTSQPKPFLLKSKLPHSGGVVMANADEETSKAAGRARSERANLPKFVMSFPSEDEAIDERVEHLGLRVA